MILVLGLDDVPVVGDAQQWAFVWTELHQCIMQVRSLKVVQIFL